MTNQFLVVLAVVSAFAAGLYIGTSMSWAHPPASILPHGAGPQSRVDGSVYFGPDAGLGVFK